MLKGISMRLAELQQALLSAVLPGGESADELMDSLANTQRPAARSLAIQRGSVHGIQTAAMGDLYPVIRRLLGEQSFDALALRFLMEKPSQRADLNFLGVGFSTFLANFQPLQDWPYLADVAALEWAWHEVFHAADTPPFDWAALAKLNEEQQAAVCLHMPAASHVLRSQYAVATIWQKNQPDCEPDDELLADTAEDVLLIRYAAHEAPQLERLNAEDAEALLAIRQGKKLGRLLRRPGFAEQLPRFVRRGWICRFSLE